MQCPQTLFEDSKAFSIQLLSDVKVTHGSLGFVHEAKATGQGLPDHGEVGILFCFQSRTASDATPFIATRRWRAHSVGVFQSLQTQILSKYSLYALYDVVPVYGWTGSGCLTTTVGVGGATAGTAVAEDCPVPAPAGSCDVGGAPADVTTLARPSHPLSAEHSTKEHLG